MVEQGRAHFQRMRHAGPVHLGQDVAGQVGFQVQVLHLRQRILRGAGQRVAAQHFDGAVAVQAAPQLGAEQTRALASGLNVRAGRFLSSVGYLNNQHAHTWDFLDAPLAYQAFLGGQFRPDGLQAKWLAPTDTLVELGVEIGSGTGFPGNDRNKNGFSAAALYAHVGDDIGAAGAPGCRCCAPVRPTATMKTWAT